MSDAKERFDKRVIRSVIVIINDRRAWLMACPMLIVGQVTKLSFQPRVGFYSYLPAGYSKHICGVTRALPA